MEDSTIKQLKDLNVSETLNNIMMDTDTPVSYSHTRNVGDNVRKILDVVKNNEQKLEQLLAIQAHMENALMKSGQFPKERLLIIRLEMTRETCINLFIYYF